MELHVIFGSGPVGKSVARELVKRGKRVRIINRSGKAADLPAEVEVVKGDAYSLDSAKTLTQGAAVIYQCAQPEYHEWAEKFPPLQANIVEAAAANGAKLVVVENLYMYGDPNGRPITEDLPHNPNTRKGRVRAAMSDALMAAHRSGKVPVAIGRASDFYGPEYDIMGSMVFQPALQGKGAQLLGKVDVPHTFTYVPDFGKALVILGENDSAFGQAWHIPNAPAVTQREFATMTYMHAGHTPKFTAVNRIMMRMVGLFSPGVRETVEMMYEFEKPFVVDSSKFIKAFGDHATPLQDGIRTTLDWFRVHPEAGH